MTTDPILSSRAHETSSYVQVLECLLNDGAIAIATDVVGQIVEYEVSELPLARDPVAGVAVVDGRLVVSLSPSTQRVKIARRWTKAVILHTGAEHGGITFALEVRDVLSLVEVAVSSSRVGSSALSRATTRDGREISWLDARELVRTLIGINAVGARG